jgi:hypothetical protein
VSTIASVTERMAAIARALPRADGVARFNHLYLSVTREMGAEAAGTAFADPEFVARLDVVFADLYFDAVDADGAGRAGGARVSRAWAPLFEARGRERIAPIQFALAGMNAHINHDLCLALLAVWDDAGTGPERGSAWHRDYLAVNAILERVEDRVKADYATGLVGIADEALGRLDDVVAMWSVARARDTAWTHAETLWELRRAPWPAEQFRLALERLVGLSGRGLLIPVL